MALVRCEQHRPQGRSHDYVQAVRPLGYPETAAVCGITGCNRPGLLWLDSEVTSVKVVYRHENGRGAPADRRHPS